MSQLNSTTYAAIQIEGLQQMHISPLRADSMVGIVTRDSRSGVWIGLLVDEKFYPLVMWKHTIGREYLHASVETACTQVQDAINALTPALVAETMQIARTLDPLCAAVDADCISAASPRQCPIHGDTAIESETMPGTWWCRVRLPNGQRCTEMLQIAA